MDILKAIRRHDSTPRTTVRRKHIPWIQSPLVQDGPNADPATPGLQTSKTQQSGILTLSSDIPRFRHYDDTHTIELVYDLFFVATLSVFTSIHGIEDPKSLTNFVGFFTILWFTWLQTTMYDVRFGIDSVFDRVCKCVTFGITTAFMLAGSVWDITEVEKNAKGFSLMAIALMVSRLTLLLQYAVVAFYVRSYKKTLLPLALTMATLFIAAVVFLGAYGMCSQPQSPRFTFRDKKSRDIHIAFYAVICLEGLSMLMISCVWRVVSFKHTRFITRMTDATMIMLGEGVVGLAVSVSKIMQNSAHVSGSIGVTMSAVLLIYFIWMLYFDQIENDRFGTIRQQIWAILHYPLNLATILVLEGMRELVAYDTIMSLDKLWRSYEPEVFLVYDPFFDIDWSYDFTPWNTLDDLIQHYKDGISELSSTLNNNNLDKKFNATFLFELWTNTSQTQSLSTEQGKAVATVFTDTMFKGVENFILEHFGVTVIKIDDVAAVNSTSGGTFQGVAAEELAALTPEEINGLNVLQNVVVLQGGFSETFRTVFWYFPMAAAAFLLLLAVMYWFGKRNKSRYEWFSIALRVLAGLGMIGYGLFLNLQNGGVWNGWGFSDTPWVIPVVVLVYFVVIIGDNFLIWWGNRVYDQRGLVARIAEETGYQQVPARGHGVGDVEMMKMRTVTREVGLA